MPGPYLFKPTHVGSNPFEALQFQASGADESEPQTSSPPSASYSPEGNHAQASQNGQQNTGEPRSPINPAIVSIGIIVALILAVIAGKKSLYLSSQPQQASGQGNQRQSTSGSQSSGAVPSSPSKSTSQPHTTGFQI